MLIRLRQTSGDVGHLGAKLIEVTEARSANSVLLTLEHPPKLERATSRELDAACASEHAAWQVGAGIVTRPSARRG